MIRSVRPADQVVKIVYDELLNLLLFGFFFALGMAGVDINRFTLLAGAFGDPLVEPAPLPERRRQRCGGSPAAAGPDGNGARPS